MADSNDEAATSAEKAYAAAAAEVKPAKAAESEAKPALEPAPEAKAPAASRSLAESKTAPARVAKKTAPKRPAKIVKTPVAKRAARVAKRAAAPVVAKKPQPALSVSELKEKIMATAKTADFTKPIADALGEYQSRAKDAYEMGTEVATEVTEFAKGNVEALVESTKIFAAGAQSLGKTYVEEAKSAYETITADVKELAAVKSPAELFQLQGKIARRNFDTFVKAASKNSEAFFNLANDAFAPLSGRVNVAAEKLSKVA